MIRLDFYKNKRVGVLGLGKTGKSAVDALKFSGAEVSVYDDKLDNDIESVKKLDALVVSPGIHLQWPHKHPIVDIAQQFAVPVLSDLDLFLQHVHQKNICITGTNGKSTTTALVGHIFGAVGDTAVGGNIGCPILSLSENSKCYVFELSSYQLEASSILGLDTAILLNITPDHLTRHGGMTGYITAKQKIFMNFTEKSHAVIGVDDGHCEKICEFLKGIGHPDVIPISGNIVPKGGIGWENDKLIDNRFGQREVICEKIESFSGNHNYQNIAAAYATCAVNGVSKDVFLSQLHTFKGLAHRQELIAEIGGVKYVNDSKATNADSVEQALKRFDNVIWILGGRPKEDGIESLIKYFTKIRFAYLIGEAAEDWSQLLTANGLANEISGTLDKAVLASSKKATELNADVVLLSPACASFDQFKDFEERGDKFRQLVMNLKS